MPTDELDQVSEQNPTGQEPARDYDKEIAELRQEAAKWRKQYRDAQGQVKELEPVATKYNELQEASKSEAEKLAERLAAMQSQLEAVKAQAEQAQKEKQFLTLAAKAGLSSDMLQYLDVNKFDLDDEEATLEALSALAPAKAANSGSASNPGRGSQSTAVGYDGLTAEEWFKGTGRKSYIFGDK